MVIDRKLVFAKRIAENISRYTPQERTVILARYGSGAYAIREALREVMKRDKKWLLT